MDIKDKLDLIIDKMLQLGIDEKTTIAHLSALVIIENTMSKAVMISEVIKENSKQNDNLKKDKMIYRSSNNILKR